MEEENERNMFQCNSGVPGGLFAGKWVLRGSIPNPKRESDDSNNLNS
jgi:hypothetical protein